MSYDANGPIVIRSNILTEFKFIFGLRLIGRFGAGHTSVGRLTEIIFCCTRFEDFIQENLPMAVVVSNVEIRVFPLVSVEFFAVTMLSLSSAMQKANGCVDEFLVVETWVDKEEDEHEKFLSAKKHLCCSFLLQNNNACMGNGFAGTMDPCKGRCNSYVEHILHPPAHLHTFTFLVSLRTRVRVDALRHPSNARDRNRTVLMCISRKFTFGCACHAMVVMLSLPEYTGDRGQMRKPL